jgi:hypothetical protein
MLALQARDFANASTEQTDRLASMPGITTIWLGSLGIFSYRTLAEQGLIENDTTLLIALQQGPVAVVTSLCVALGYVLLRRLVRPGLALVAALVWASEPFLVAHASRLHTDALLTSFILLAVLAAFVAFRFAAPQPLDQAPIRWRLLLLSGAAGGLALLTKMSGLLVLPMVGLIGMVGIGRSVWTRNDAAEPHPTPRWQHIIPRAVGIYVSAALLWAVVAVAVCLVLWPALWADPVTQFERMARSIMLAETPPQLNFFLGEITTAPGPLFYPVALAMRMTPWMMIGLVLAPLMLLQQRANITHPERLLLIMLLLLILVYIMPMSMASKKFDRYALPIFPLLGILSAYGLYFTWEWVSAQWNTLQQRPAWWAYLVSAGFVLMLTANLAWYHPYYLAYYNPLLGGSDQAPDTLLIGWGEGLELAHDYIAAQPDGCEKPVAVIYPIPSAFPCSDARSINSINSETIHEVNYVVLYINQLQRQIAPQSIAAVQEHAELVHTVVIHGVPYAYIYRVTDAAEVQRNPACTCQGTAARTPHPTYSDRLPGSNDARLRGTAHQ